MTRKHVILRCPDCLWHGGVDEFSNTKRSYCGTALNVIEYIDGEEDQVEALLNIRPDR